jgi:hypothetical protein
VCEASCAADPEMELVREVVESELGGSLGADDDDAEDEAPTVCWLPRTLPRPKTRPEIILAVHEVGSGRKCARHGGVCRPRQWFASFKCWRGPEAG